MQNLAFSIGAEDREYKVTGAELQYYRWKSSTWNPQALSGIKKSRDKLLWDVRENKVKAETLDWFLSNCKHKTN